MKTYTIKDLNDHVTESLKHFPTWRKGQSYFNCLWNMDTELANELRGSDKDPFYSDDKIADFLKAVEEKWNSKD